MENTNSAYSPNYDKPQAHTHTHTPTPWELIPLIKNKTKSGELGNFLIRSDEAPGGIAITIGGLGNEEDANAAFIVLAVNCHEELVTFAKVLREYMIVNKKDINEDMFEHLNGLLAKAEGR